jgi:hypothetical protein
LLEHGPAQGGFARPDFSSKLNKAFTLTDAIKKMIFGLAMLDRIKQELGVGSDVERGFF